MSDDNAVREGTPLGENPTAGADKAGWAARRAIATAMGAKCIMKMKECEMICSVVN